MKAITKYKMEMCAEYEITGDVDCCGWVCLPGEVHVLVLVDGTLAGIDFTEPLCAVWLVEIGEFEFIGPFETCAQSNK